MQRPVDAGLDDVGPHGDYGVRRGPYVTGSLPLRSRLSSLQTRISTLWVASQPRRRRTRAWLPCTITVTVRDIIGNPVNGVVVNAIPIYGNETPFPIVRDNDRQLHGDVLRDLRGHRKRGLSDRRCPPSAGLVPVAQLFEQGLSCKLNILYASLRFTPQFPFRTGTTQKARPGALSRCRQDAVGTLRSWPSGAWSPIAKGTLIYSAANTLIPATFAPCIVTGTLGASTGSMPRWTAGLVRSYRKSGPRGASKTFPRS
jgi:hypothetical protein